MDPVLQANHSESPVQQLRSAIEQWYVWLSAGHNPFPSRDFNMRIRLPYALCVDTMHQIQKSANEQIESFLSKGIDTVRSQLHPVRSIKEEAFLKQKRNSENALHQLREAIETWYAWLGSSPPSLFGQQDVSRMFSTVQYFHESVEWLARTTVSNTDWFFQAGSEIVMNRWLKEDYDSYE